MNLFPFEPFEIKNSSFRRRRLVAGWRRRRRRRRRRRGDGERTVGRIAHRGNNKQPNHCDGHNRRSLENECGWGTSGQQC